MCDSVQTAETVVKTFKFAMLQNDLVKAGQILQRHALCENFSIDKIVDGTPALVAAVQLNKPAFVSLLLLHGADRGVRDTHGHTAYFYINPGNIECLHMLLVSAGAFPEGRAL
jgi:hypothetical protein